MSQSNRLFHYQQFLPLANLHRKLRQEGLSVSVVIPALNEQDQIGRIIHKVRAQLQESIPLVDEIVVMDGDSTDGTREEARMAGATVHSVSEIDPAGCPNGKGTALWKSQFVTRGDIVVCIDADIVDFDARFVYALIGPFVQNRGVSFAKAFYKRPLALNGNLADNQGGRVTEIMVRPFLATFFPELARIRQPLSGEYAFRRDFMSTVPFSSGYGVEIGLILDIYNRYGLEGIVEVDMDVRLHRNRPVDQLGKMSFAILHTLCRKLQDQDYLRINRELGQSMVTWSGTQWEETRGQDVVLPPAREHRSNFFGGNGKQ